MDRGRRSLRLGPRVENKGTVETTRLFRGVPGVYANKNTELNHTTAYLGIKGSLRVLLEAD